MTQPASHRVRRRHFRLWRKNKSFLYNLHPPRIPAAGARFTYTFGLGGLAVLTAFLTLVTGLLLMFYYVPTVERAHTSLAFIESVVAGGSFIRALHYWAAQAMVAVVMLHLARIVFTGGYRSPRDFNWLVGLGLLVVTLLWDFTGYTLRWDAGSLWALLVGTNLLKVAPGVGAQLYRLVVGDVILGENALLRFYTWHVFGLTLLGTGGIGYHIWRIRVDGGISHPLPTPGRPRSFIPRETLFYRELLAALLASSALILLSAVAPPPLLPAADLSVAGNAEVKAPWFFLAIQELLRHLPPLWAGWIVPLSGLGLLAALPFIDRRGPGRGEWFARSRWKPQAMFGGLAVLIIALTVIAALR
ncbi:MAG: DUF4405 domain-containing protein [Caldilineae bacterium]|nr:MAG: DUF4405 domain-containing protein [Caldilineae bacterium]